MKLLVFSDVHVRQGVTIPGRLDDQEATLQRIATLAVEQQVDAVLFGGDMFEGPTVPSSDYLRVGRALRAPLAAAGIPVVAISGNQTHDLAGSQGEHNAMAVLHDPGRFDVYTRPGLHVLGSVFRQDLVVACVPWASVARLRAMLDGGDIDDVDQMAAQLVIRIMADLRAQAAREHPGVPCIGLSHFATTDWKTPSGLPTDGDVSLGVTLPLDDLERIGFDAMFLGHIHAPGVINDNGLSERGSESKTSAANPVPAGPLKGSPTGPRSLSPIVSLGSPLYLSHGEEHVEHGVWLWDNGHVEFVPIPGRAFLTIDVSAEAAAGLLEGFWTDDIVGAIVRVRVSGSSDELRRISPPAIERAVIKAGAHHCKAVTVPMAGEARARVAGLDTTVAPLTALDQWIGQNGGVTDTVAAGLRDWTARALETIA